MTFVPVFLKSSSTLKGYPAERPCETNRKQLGALDSNLSFSYENGAGAMSEGVRKLTYKNVLV
jgi:hypothetical protein